MNAIRKTVGAIIIAGGILMILVNALYGGDRDSTTQNASNVYIFIGTYLAGTIMIVTGATVGRFFRR